MQGGHRRRDGGSGAKPEKIDPALSRDAFFFAQIHMFQIYFPPNLDFFNRLHHYETCYHLGFNYISNREKSFLKNVSKLQFLLTGQTQGKFC